MRMPGWAGALLMLLVGGCTSDTIKQSLTIGAACMASSDCGSDPPFSCATDHPGGHCQKDCKSDFDCPPEATCAFTGGAGLCHLKCPPGMCRTGYVCKPASNDPSQRASHAYCDAADVAGGGGGDMSSKPQSDGPGGPGGG